MSSLQMQQAMTHSHQSYEGLAAVGHGNKQGQDQSQQKKNSVPPSLAILKLVLFYNACGHCDAVGHASRKTIVNTDEMLYTES